jgi:hypothetical protein
METKMTNPPDITKLDDARDLKRAGLPVGLPIVRKEFTREYSEHWIPLMKAHAHFVIAMREFSDRARQGSPGKWKLVKRRFDGLSKAMLSCDAFVGKLGGNVDPPVFKSEQDGARMRHSLGIPYRTICPSPNTGKAQLRRLMTGHH